MSCSDAMFWAWILTGLVVVVLWILVKIGDNLWRIKKFIGKIRRGLKNE